MVVMTDTPKYLQNADDLSWTSFPGHGRFNSEDKLLTEGTSARRMDVSLTRLAPGQVSCPYHFHHVNEEIFIIASGTGTLRYNGRTHAVRAGDVITCPPGPDSAHQLINDGAEPLVYYAISTEDPVEICEYPDSHKTLTFAEHGGKRHSRILAHEPALEYWHGEAAEAPLSGLSS